MNSDEIKSRIEKLETEKNQLDKRQRNLEALMNKKKKDEDTRRKIILGATIFAEMKKKENLRKYIVGLLSTLRERDKELFKEFLEKTEETTSGQWVLRSR